MTWLLFILGCLATFRLSLLVSKEDGPAFIFRKLRRAPPEHSATSEWLSCFFCISVTASAVVCALLWAAEVRLAWPVWVLLWLAFSSFAILLNQKFTPGSLKEDDEK
jgi:hypothetical protein